MAENSNITPQTGRCTCGAVTVTAHLRPVFRACDCDTCRRWQGVPWQGIPCEDGPKTEGKLVFRRSSHTAERASCALCVMPIYIHFTSSGRIELNRALFGVAETGTFAPEGHAPLQMSGIKSVIQRVFQGLIRSKFR